MKISKMMSRDRAFALISTLMIIAVLTIMVVAFMQSMRIDRLTARSYLDKKKAELLAEAAAEAATARITSVLMGNPYNATAFTNFAVGTSNIPVPVIYGATNFSGTPVNHFLISTPTSTTAPNFSATPTNSTRQLFVEMNFTGSGAGAAGVMGSPLSTNGAIQYASRKAPWVYVLQDPSKPEQPKKNQPNYNPIVGRYAYWVDDESSKIDYTISGNRDDGNLFRRDSESRLPEDIDIGALPLNAGLPLASDATSGEINSRVVDFYANFPQQHLKSVDGQMINRVGGVVGTNVYSAIQFYGTPYSKSIELTGTGKRRVNINGLVSNSLVANDIKANLDDIGYVITGRHIFTGVTGSVFGTQGDLTAAEQPLPLFGNRFFPAATPPSAAQRDIYIKKIAANIRDYIDTDSQPTLVDAFGVVQSGSKQLVGWGQGVNPQALGKEAVPYFQEHMWRGKEASWPIRATGSTLSTNPTFTLEFYQYFEFYNPSTKDWTAPAGTYLRGYELPTWEAGASTFKLRDFEIDLSGEVFPAGKVTVVTTDPSPPSGMMKSPGKVITRTIDPTLYRWSGTSTLTLQIDGTNYKGIRLDGRNSQYTDYFSEFVWGTPQGILDSHAYLAIAGSGGDVWAHGGNYTGAATGSGVYFGATMRGNDHISRSGDPRSISEQLQTKGGAASLGSDQTRFFNNVARTLVSSEHSLGQATISWITPLGGSGKVAWPDYTPAFNDTTATSYMYIRDASMRSIGELGNIYDPFRYAGEFGVIYSRAGGRTLKVGQRDDLVTGTRFSANWQTGAWRLCDLFGVDSDPAVKFLDAEAEGKININGVLRDNGVALKALLRRFQFVAMPNSDPNLAGRTISQTEIDAFVSSIKTYLSTTGPMMDRGELSQIAYFSGANPLGGVSFATTNDRGREELFRRTVELITTRSASYKVYVVAEALQQLPNGNLLRVSKHSFQRSIALTPQIADTPNAKVSSYYVETTNEIHQ